MAKISRRSFLTTSVTAGLICGGGYWSSADDQSSSRGNPFLEDNFAPIREEIVADDLKVVGRLPPELNGLFVRNGSNPQFPPKLNYHWFDGDGMLHGVRIQDGKASYRNRW